MRDELSDLRPIDIASVVSADYVFDFTILYESLLESWALYPFRLHAYALDDEAHSRLADAGLPGVEVHRVGASSDDWWQNAAQKIALVERSGLDRCLVSDVDNVFVQETPELFLLLDHCDFAFIASPLPDWPIQTNIWGFRSNEHDGVLPQGVFGVRSAVDEFFGARRLPVKATHVDAPWSSWFVEIPATAVRPKGRSA